jgi:hypothetical protein
MTAMIDRPAASHRGSAAALPLDTAVPSAEGKETGVLRRLLTNPLFYLLAPVVVSALIWAVPGTSDQLRGFTQRAEGTFEGWVLIVCFYLVTAFAVWLGFRLGVIAGPSERLIQATSTERFDRRFSLTLTVFATIGVLFLVQQQTNILDALSATQGNQLKESIGGSAGIATLRYTAAISAPVALYVWRFRSGRLSLAIWNVLLLVMSALFSSRLSFIMAVVVLIFIVINLRKDIRFKAVPVALAGAAIFGALVAFNYFRNAGFYENLGITDPISMNFYQVAAYLGTPFQASLGVADGIANGGYRSGVDLVSATAILVPTFFRPDGFGSFGSFSSFVQVAPNLTTNSAFADTYADYGWWGLAYVILTLFLASMLAGYASRFRSLVIVAGAVVAYGLAEVWRIFLFAQGLVLYLLIAVFAATIFGLFGSSTRQESRIIMRGPDRVGR